MSRQAIVLARVYRFEPLAMTFSRAVYAPSHPRRRDKGEDYLSAYILAAFNPKVPPEPFNKRGWYVVAISCGRHVITLDTRIL